MCVHTILQHSCGHLRYCPELLTKCDDLLQNLTNYDTQPLRIDCYGETSWNLYASVICPIDLPAEGIHITGSAPWELPSDLVDEIYGSPYAEVGDVFDISQSWKVHACPTDFFAGRPGRTTNLVIRRMPFSCGCDVGDFAGNRVEFWERKVALAYELGLMTRYEQLAWPRDPDDPPRRGSRGARRGGRSGRIANPTGASVRNPSEPRRRGGLAHSGGWRGRGGPPRAH